MPAKRALKTKKTTPEVESSPPSVASRIHPIRDSESGVSMMVYGRSGTGKTAFASSWPKPLLMIDINERGQDTIAHVPDIDVVEVDTWTDLLDLFWYLSDGSSHKYSTVVIDQVTQMQKLALMHCMHLENIDEGETINKRVWGQTSSEMGTWLYNYRNLIESKINVLFIAHERTFEVEDYGDEQINPTVGARLMPSVASALNGAVNIIGHTFIRQNEDEKMEYCMRLGPHPYFITKTRQPLGSEPLGILTNPTFGKLMSISRGESPAKKSPTIRRK